MESSAHLVTQLLERARDGDLAARDELFRLTYDELHRLAEARLRDERPGRAPDASSLVNEVSLRLLEGERLPGENRAQFLACVSRAMRNILVDRDWEVARMWLLREMRKGESHGL
ncbi:MAG: hypothetical protein HY721_10380 [Planctomycetes bacterium]|nr:hypothetical protein [Planctomycetota bacterium]